MDKATFDKYLEDRYINSMDYYSKAAAKYHKRYNGFQWILIILSALTPVLAALNGMRWSLSDKTIVINLLVVLVSSIVAILTTGLKTFSYQELWITYRSTYEKLKPEIHYYNFNVGEYGRPGIDKESFFVSRVEAILDKEHIQWPPAKKLQEDLNKSSTKKTESEAISEADNKLNTKESA